MHRLIFFTLLVPFTSCSAESDPVSVLGDTISVNGRIAPGLAATFLAQDFRGVKYISIKSRGGSNDDAISIAKKIQSLGLTLIIDKECMSACASIILPSARSVRVLEGSRIALHTTSLGLKELYSATKARDGHKIVLSSKIVQNTEDVLGIYRRSQVDPRLLLLPYLARGEMCYQAIRQKDGATSFGIGSEKLAYIVSPATLRAFGVNIEVLVEGTPNGRAADRPEFVPVDVDLAKIVAKVHEGCDRPPRNGG